MAKRKNADEDSSHSNSFNKKLRMDLSTSISDQEFVLSKEIVENVVLTDISQKVWRVGNPIGKGSFGEIFLASDKISKPVTSENAKYVVKIEPHHNGPLFVEIHCLLNTGKATEGETLPPGMPEYIASGSHYFQDEKYRFLILKRYKCDLHSLIKNRRVDPKCVLIIANQIMDVLEHFHDKGYAHSDIKSENLMIGSCTYKKDKNFNFDDRENGYHDATPRKSRSVEAQLQSSVQFSGSNPIRSCRTNRKNSMYDDMLQSHYLRPNKSVNYSKYYEESEYEYNPKKEEACDDEDYDEDDSNITVPVDKVLEEKVITEDRIFLIDFGLASKFMDANGHHRPFCMDQRRAHDGTLEFTSRDAHMGAHSRRSDLECLGYNLLYWCQGTLPWKDEKMLQQPDQVHHMKEYFMTDVKAMLPQVYGKNVPSFLGEFLNYVGNLAYDERPDYGHCRHIFEKAMIAMGYSVEDMVLNTTEIKQKVQKLTPLPDKLANLKHVRSIMKLGIHNMLPFRETHGSNKISPKNLRSKSDAKEKKLNKKKFSWTEILSSNPDQIARQRAEKEFERDQLAQTPVVAKYTGRPTYAILEIENRLKFKDKLDTKEECDTPDFKLKGYTKPMMDILRRREAYIMSKLDKSKKSKSAPSPPSSPEQPKTVAPEIVAESPLQQRPKKRGRPRKKETPTKNSIVFTETIVKKKLRFTHSSHRTATVINFQNAPDDEDSRISTQSTSTNTVSISSASEHDTSDASGARYTNGIRTRRIKKKNSAVKQNNKPSRGSHRTTIKKSQTKRAINKNDRTYSRG